ncbi:hypothetical protein C8R43DRAFT_351958 [Mycena crocata]|nr:hypothetical protein C8R43DRAFT_351958 [Mycena crocata]
MHPDLSLRKLSQLPFHLRRIANAACAATRSPQDIKRLSDEMDGVPNSTKVLVLPALYILLDPEGIPTLEELDTPLHLARPFPLLIVCTLHSLLMTDIPRHLGPEVWPRAWKWVWFAHTYRDQLPELLSAVPELYMAFVQFSGHLNGNNIRAVPFICTEPGFYSIIACAWEHLLDDSTKHEGALRDICNFLAIYIHMAPNPAATEEMVDAVGGLDNLALLVVRYLSWTLETRGTPVVDRDSYYIHIIVRFATVTGGVGIQVKDTFGPFTHSLLDHGIIPLLATAAAALADTCGDSEKDALDRCFAFLIELFDSDGASYVWLPAAVKNGLLLAIVASASGVRIEEQLESLITVISASLVYYPIPATIAAALRPLETLVSSAAFQTSTIYENWLDFTDLVQERLEVMQMFDSDEYVYLKACDNLECTIITDKAAFKRCSGCHSYYYCSKECQLVDWRAGGHRDACAESSAVQLNESQRLSFRERGFLRALVHHDYRAAKAEIFERMALALRRHPATDLFISFNYTVGAVKISIFSASESDVSISASWKDFISRAGRSRGRISPYIVSITGRGLSKRDILLPLRRSHGDIVGMLERTVKDLHEVGTDEKSKIGSLLKLSEKDLVETH